MKGKYYTFFIASSSSGDMQRVRVPFFVLHLLAVLAAVGGITVIAGMGSYSRMLWKTTDYNSLRRQQDSLKQQYTQLQTQVKDTNQRLNSLQSLAGEVAIGLRHRALSSRLRLALPTRPRSRTLTLAWIRMLRFRPPLRSSATFRKTLRPLRCRAAVCGCFLRLN